MTIRDFPYRYVCKIQDHLVDPVDVGNPRVNQISLGVDLGNHETIQIDKFSITNKVIYSN